MKDEDSRAKGEEGEERERDLYSWKRKRVTTKCNLYRDVFFRDYSHSDFCATLEAFQISSRDYLS